MTSATKYIHRTKGTYLGFITNGFFFSRDGEYLGWLEDNFVWDAKGRFRGQLWNDKYIIFNQFSVLPVPRAPKPVPATPALPAPATNLAPISLPTGWTDSF